MLIRASVLLFWLALGTQAAQWTVIGPGGGGTLYLPTISPHDPNVVLTHCDMTGSYITHDGGASWRMFNLRGTSRIFAFDPSDPKTIYAYSMGLFRSTDSGRAWNLVYPDPAQVDRIIMPDDHAGEHIILKQGRADRIGAFAIHPADSKKLYAAMVEGRGGRATLQMSADYGKTWKKLADLSGGANRILVDRAGTVYVVGRNAVGILRDGVWKDGAPAPGDGFRDVSAGFANNKLVVWGVQGSGLVVSEDSGATWRSAEIRPGHVAGYRAIATSLNHPQTAYVSYGIRGVGSGVAKTTDVGKTWELVWNDTAEAASNMHDPWMYARFGPGWTGAPSELGVAPNDPAICWGVTSGSAVKTTDGGKNWYGVYAKQTAGGGVASTGLDVTTNYGVHFDPFDRKRMFISYTDIGLFASDDGGKSWESVTRTVPRPWVNTTYWMEFDPEVKGRVWAVMSGIHDLPRPKMWRDRAVTTYNGGVTVSDDGGRTWRVASEALPPTAATHIVLDAKSPKESRTLYVTGFGRGVFKSTDGGRTWALKNTGIAGKEPFAWRITRQSDGTLYLVVARRSEDGSINNDQDGALYRSRNAAETWEWLRLPEGVNGPNGLAIDPADPKRLYLAAWGRQTSDGAVGGGVYVSADGGASWKRTLARDQHVYDVTVDARNNALYACGFEDSAWRSQDHGETWRRIPGYNFKWGHRVAPDPYNPNMIYITTFGGSVYYGPAEGDPNSPEDIVTPGISFPKK
jgi:photosystem II stability/assembly factor-like uncharacterized protein